MEFKSRPFLIINAVLAILIYWLEITVEYFDPGTEQYMKITNSANAVIFHFLFFSPFFFLVLMVKNGLAVYLKQKFFKKINRPLYYFLVGVVFSLVYTWKIHHYSVFIYPFIPLLETLLFGFFYAKGSTKKNENLT
jgi:di/tricarboxylate transporter